MAKKEKRTPKYMIEPVNKPQVQSKTGNPSKQITLDVPMLNADGTIKIDSQNNIEKESVTETYVWNQDHRTTLKSNKGCWTIPILAELDMFEQCRTYGLYKKWKGTTHMGWNILYQNNQVNNVGKGVDSDNKWIDVKVGKFGTECSTPYG